MELRNFLIGSLLGDGAFVKKSPNHNTYAQFKHCESQYEYLNWKFNFLDRHGLIRYKTKGIVKVNINPESVFDNFQDQYKFATISSEKLNFIKELSDNDILSMFNEEIFAVWLLDDGNVNNKVIKISCGKKSIEFCKGIVEKLNTELHLCAYLYQHPVNPKKNTINIRVQSYNDVKNIILTHFPADLDVVAHKFQTETDYELPIKIKYSADISPLAHIGGDYASNWIDLRAAETVEMKQGEYRLISLGVSMQLPEGYEGHVVPRSSTFKNFGIILANSMGIIDESYCGDNDIWRFPAIAMRDTVINKGDRICQFRIMEKMPKVNFIKVETLGNADRGGIGSTGIK